MIIVVCKLNKVVNVHFGWICINTWVEITHNRTDYVNKFELAPHICAKEKKKF